MNQLTLQCSCKVTYLPSYSFPWSPEDSLQGTVNITAIPLSLACYHPLPDSRDSRNPNVFTIAYFCFMAQAKCIPLTDLDYCFAPVYCRELCKSPISQAPCVGLPSYCTPRWQPTHDALPVPFMSLSQADYLVNRTLISRMIGTSLSLSSLFTQVYVILFSHHHYPTSLQQYLQFA